MESDMFGRHVKFSYSETWVGYSLLSLRLVMGWTFFLPGIKHAWNPEWSARGLLMYSANKPGNPLQPLWAEMVEWVWILTPLNSIGLTLVGLALILGAFVRFSAFWGSVMMMFYWAAALPLENAFLVDDHIVYVLLLFGLGAFGSGRILGLDAKLEQLSIVEKYPKLKLFMG
jgi:thiosulfate dehydrogenase [quinone] large subunit